MKKALFKFLFPVLIAVLCISAVPVSIYAADSDFEIVLNVGGKTGYIHKYNGTDENVVIPSHTKSGVPITSIEMNAFSGNTYIKSVTVPATETEPVESSTAKVNESEATEGTTTSIAPAFTEVTTATAPSDSTKPSEKPDDVYVIGDVNMKVSLISVMQPPSRRKSQILYSKTSLF